MTPSPVIAAQCEVDAVLRQRAMAEAVLVPQELDRLKSLPRSSSRAAFLASRWLLRRLLAEILDQPPASLPLLYPPGQAPVLRDSQLNIGLSHGGNRCLAVAAGAQQVGCDVEPLRARRSLDAIAKKHFDPRESVALASLAGDDQIAVFHRLWTLKEASKKARGRGVWSGLNRPAFNVTDGYREFADPFEGRGVFASALADDGHAMALALYSERPLPPPELRCLEYSGPGAGVNVVGDWRWLPLD